MLECTITPPGGGTALALHNLGEVTLLSQQSAYSPDELPQRETRTIGIKIAVWQQNWADNYDLVCQVRDVLKLPRVNVQISETGGTYTPTGIAPDVTLPSTDIYNREFDVVSCDLPENPNAWGTFQQEIHFTLRTEFTDLVTTDTDHLTAVFTPNHTVAGTPSAGTAITLGNITGWKVDYKSTRYNESKNIRERATGNISASGEFLENTGTATTNYTIASRRTLLLAKIQAMQAAVNGRDGLLVLGANKSAQFFNKTVKVDDFNAEINHAVTGIKWSLTASYTEFPDEATFAAADFSVVTNEDMESGDVTLEFSGKVGAASESVALSKLALLRTAVLAQNTGHFGATGTFALTDRTKSNVTKRQVSVGDDTHETPASGAGADRVEFIELSFSESYRKRSANIYTFNLTVADNEDQRTGVRTRTYSGHVVCSGNSYTAARNNAVQAAYTLGRASGTNPDQQMRVSARLTETYRHVTPRGATVSPSIGAPDLTTREFVGLDFSFEFLAPMERIYLELSKEASTETFGETTERWSGFVVARDEATARTSGYDAIVVPILTGLKRSESFSTHQQKIQSGSFATGAVAPPVAFTPTATPPSPSGFATLSTRLDFSVACLKERTATYAIRYGIRVEIDYSALRKNVVISGKLSGTKAQIEAAQQETGGNVLDAFLTSLGFPTSGSPPSQPNSTWRRLNRSRGSEFEQIGVSASTATVGAAPSNAYLVSMDFSETFTSRLTGFSSILQCEVAEEMQYSGTRWVEGMIPDGPSIIMNCGTTMATRSITGTVTAATEALGMAWVHSMKSLAFPTNALLGTVNGNVAQPSTRYHQPPRISRAFEFIPMLSGDPRGGTPNETFVKLSFTFSELIPDAQYA